MTRQLDERFLVDATSDTLLRSVKPRRGQPYEHSCSKAVYCEVAYAIERLGNTAFTLEEIRHECCGGVESSAPPFTQVAVAVAFLKERGCIIPARKRRHVAATDFVYEDALIEYHALREKGPGDAAFGCA